MKLSKFSFGTVKNEQIDYEKLACHRENVHPSKQFEVLEYEPAHLLATMSKISVGSGLGGEQEHGDAKSTSPQGASVIAGETWVGKVSPKGPGGSGQKLQSISEENS